MAIAQREYKHNVSVYRCLGWSSVGKVLMKKLWIVSLCHVWVALDSPDEVDKTCLLVVVLREVHGFSLASISSSPSVSHLHNLIWESKQMIGQSNGLRDVLEERH